MHYVPILTSSSSRSTSAFPSSTNKVTISSYPFSAATCRGVTLRLTLRKKYIVANHDAVSTLLANSASIKNILIETKVQQQQRFSAAFIRYYYSY